MIRRTGWHLLGASWFIVVFIGVVSVLADEVSLESDSAAKNYSTQLPRIPPTEPQDSLAGFQIADGFQIDLVAHEPVVADPIAMAFDERGGLFVVCMHGYSEDGDQNLGVVKRLEDRDGDGRYETSTDYVTGLSWPTAIACYDGGVFVAAPPQIHYFKDTDGDDVSDERKLVLDGFARSNVQGMANSFRWGLDNRLYVAAGVNGGDIVSAIDGRTTSIRGRDLSIDPLTLTMRPESGGSQHGATFDRWGERFVCSNSDHFQWIEFQDRHLRRNPLLNGYRSRKSIAADGASAEVYRTSPVEPWRIVRTRLRVKGMVGGPVEGGGRASGYFTSASGITAYTGGSFSSRFQRDDYFFVGDVGSNLVHLKRVVTDGLSKRAERATPPREEFLTSTDNWFRPVQFANGPDGALYVLDMYREVIEHPLSLPPMIKQHLDLTSGRTRGRIYRISRRQAGGDTKASTKEAVKWPSAVDDRQLVAMVGHANGWHRETAARLIAEKCSRSSSVKDQFAPLLNEACTAESPYARIRAMYCLNTIGRLSESKLVTRLRDEDTHVRIHALKLLESVPHVGEATTSELTKLVDDTDIRISYQLALTLGRFPRHVRRELLVELAMRFPDNAKMRFAVLSSMGEDRFSTFAAILERSNGVEKSSLLEEIALQLGRSRTSVAEAMELVSTEPEVLRFRILGKLLEGTGKRGNALLKWLEQHDVAEPTQRLRDVMSIATRRAMDRKVAIGDRIHAIRTLQLGDFEDVGNVFAAILAPNESAEIRNAATEVLANFSSPRAAEVLIGVLPSLPPTGRRRALELLTSRATWAATLVRALADDVVSVSQLSASYRNGLLRHRDKDVALLAAEVLGAVVESDRARVVASYTKLLDRTGNVERGKALFRKSCATCHRLDDHGSNVGPNLAPLRNRGAAFMLTNILDPNREVDARYEAYNVVTTDGRSISGLLQSDGVASIELIQADKTVLSVSKADIELLTATGRSLMPEGLEKDLGEQGIADVIAYLVQPGE